MNAPPAAMPGQPMKIYLSGVISQGGTLPDDQIRANLNQFKRAALILRERGHEVVDPTELRPPGLRPTWRDWMVVDLKALLDCDRIVLLPGWEGSPGARLEHHVAVALGMPVDHYDRAAAPGGADAPPAATPSAKPGPSAAPTTSPTTNAAPAASRPPHDR